MLKFHSPTLSAGIKHKTWPITCEFDSENATWKFCFPDGLNGANSSLHRIEMERKKKTCEKLKSFKFWMQRDGNLLREIAKSTAIAKGHTFESQNSSSDLNPPIWWLTSPYSFFPSLSLFFFSLFFGGTTKSVFRVQWRRINFSSLLSKSHESADKTSRTNPDPRSSEFSREEQKSREKKRRFLWPASKLREDFKDGQRFC